MGDLDQALRRLNAALEAAEAAATRALDTVDAARAREEELQAFADDRQRLADLLDLSAAKAEASEARHRTLEQEVGRRLDAAIGAVESVLSEAGA
ncbi:DUF4164 family protein [Chenggangzhangella methanolivorans]|uniref:DUF4164 family protein n=1 Tax=Chenggangzhangella methanolivorans TaxID=1437009 RepID=A0A9E6UM76_9HYPH|nr:DUF4164 family protein [Chenggangzhangella methanolivorans]QZO01382.1 DUF4164 family protein [Chenggangzhangella methanolivorans]